MRTACGRGVLIMKQIGVIQVTQFIKAMKLKVRWTYYLLVGQETRKANDDVASGRAKNRSDPTKVDKWGSR